MEKLNPATALRRPTENKLSTKPTIWTPSQRLPKNREKILVAIVQHIERGRGMPEPELEFARLDAVKMATALTRIADDDLFPAFQLAWNSHKNPREPFGVIQINRAYDELLELRIASRRKADGERILRELRTRLVEPQCHYCNDTGLQIVRHRDGYTSGRPCVCPRSNGPVPERPLCEEDGWTKNHRNEWERTTE